LHAVQALGSGDLRHYKFLPAQRNRMDAGNVTGAPMQGNVPDRARPLPSAVYEALDLNRLVVFTLGWLREASQPPTFENVSVTAFRLFPAKFSLRGYEHPDSNRVNRALLQLGPKYRNWAVGSTSTGFALTPLGESILAETRQLLQTGGEQPRPGRRSTKGYTWDPSAEIIDLKSKDAFRRFRERGPKALDMDDVWDALGAFRYTSKEAIHERIVALKSIAAEAGDADALGFLEALRKRFEGKRRRGQDA
jgi:hypothetical protein